MIIKKKKYTAIRAIPRRLGREYVGGKQWPLKDVYVLIPGIHECAMSHGKRDFEDVIKL